MQSRGIREPIPFAVVEQLDGGAQTEAGADGRFTLELPAGQHQLSVRASGHQPLVVEESLGAGTQLEVVYRLEPVAARAWETVVRARREEGPARVELSRVETHDIAGTLGDPFRVTMLLPGITAIASGIAYPVVRGTQPAATGFYLDGVKLPQLYHLLAGPSVVHPDFIDHVDVYTGAPPTRYGRLLGGVIDGKLAKPPPKLAASASLDLLNAGAFVSVPITALNLDVAVAGRVSYMGPVATAVARALFPSTPEQPRPNPVVNFGDYQARLEWSPSPGKLRVFALGSMDEAGTRQAGPGTVTALLSSTFHRVDVAWRQRLGGGQLEAGALVGTERLGLLGERDGATFGQFLMRRESLQARARWNGPIATAGTLEAGVEAERQWTGITIDRDPGALPGPAASFREPATNGTLLGAWLESSWKTGRWAVQGGLRLDGYLLDGGVTRVAIEPRALVRFALTPNVTLRSSAGLSHQAPTVLLNFPVSDLAGLRDGLQQVVRFDVGADAQLPLKLELSSSAFFNPVTRAIEYSLEDLLTNRARLGAGTSQQGRAYGLELMVRRRPGGRWFGWLSYTLMRSERFRTVYEFDDLGDVAGHRTAWVPFEFDQAHVLNVTGGVVLPWNVRVSAGVRFNTGRPESGVVSSRAQRPGVESGTLEPSWVPVSLTTEPRLPAFFRVDARVSKTWTFDAFVLEAFLDVFNVSVTSEVLGYTYLVNQTAAGRELQRQAFALPVVLPFLGVKGSY